MRKPHEKTIDDVQYVIHEMNPFKSSALLTRMIKLLGKPMAQVIGGIKKVDGQSVLDSKVDETLIGAAVEELSKKLDEKEVQKLMKDLMPLELITYKTSEMEDFKKMSNHEGHFAKFSLLHLFKVVKFSLEVNFQDFFGGLAELKE